MKKLIAHYSWSGTTKKAAQKLAKKEGADLLEITVPGHVYDLGMRQVADLAISQLENKEYPVIAHDQVPLVSYDQIIVAAPVWSGEPAVPAYSFLNANFPEQSNSSPLRKCPKPAKILYF